MFPTKLAAVFSLFAVSALAAPASNDVFQPSGPQVDIVFSPHITAPEAGAVWQVNSTQVITWSTAGIPTENQGQTGLILLGHIADGSVDEHLDTVHPLASNFPITAGNVTVTVPEVETRDDYVIVLFGDSGNTSPKFTITPAA